MKQRIAGRWEIIATIGQGGMGDVFRGMDHETGDPVAIKLLKPDILDTAPHLVERFRREGELLRQLNHPNIVRMLDMVEENDLHYIIMEYVPGGDLRDLLVRQVPLPLDRTLEIALDLADALTRAHRLNVIHRDIKPANVLLAADGTPRLTDFGIARISGATGLTDTGMLAGTLHYASPEVCSAQPVDARADIWGLGVILFEMLAACRPFDGDQPAAVISAILTQPPPDLEALRPDAPVGLVDLIYRMLEKERTARIPSVRQVGAELEAILHGARINQTQPESRFAGPVPIRGLPKHTLHAQLTPFVGREIEMGTLGRLMADPARRLVTVTGPGGIGKTRLALEFAAQQVERFAGGVLFVPLAAASAEDGVIAAVADALAFTFSPFGDRRQQLLTYLGGPNLKHMLLLLDNFEHLLDAAPLVSDMLRAAPNLKIIVTSRERLDLSGEIPFDLGGMEVPAFDLATPERALEYGAIRLFVQSAQRVRPGFALQAADVPHVQRICRSVQGMPLGIVLAAAWVEMLSPQEVADEIDMSLDFLESTLRDAPERHRSLRVVFESAWNKLTDTERDTFMKLSIFRGGVARPIAQYVTRASLRTLAALVNKSLLRRDPDSGRYEVHELLRQYAAEQLEASGQAAATRNIHSHYYVSFLAQREADMRGGRRQWDAIKEIDADFENVFTALTWLIQQRNADAVGMALESFFLYCLLAGSFEEAATLLYPAQVQFAPPLRAEPGLLWARLAVRAELARTPHADRAQIERALAVAQRHDDHTEIAFCLWTLGYVASSTGDYAQAVALMKQSLAIYGALDNAFYTGRVMSDIGLFYGVMGQHGPSTAYLEQSLAIQRAIGDEGGAMQTILRNGLNTTFVVPGG